MEPLSAEHVPPAHAGTGSKDVGPSGVVVEGSGDASAQGGIANTGYLHIDRYYAAPHDAPPSNSEGSSGSVAWPIRVGRLPGLASAFQPRTRITGLVCVPALSEVGVDRLSRGSSDVLVGEAARFWKPSVVLTGGGGVGKSQLAAACAIEAIQSGIDIVVWADASNLDSLLSTFATAGAHAHVRGVTGAPGDVEGDAREFRDWLANTKRTWLIVLDNVVDPARILDWWPTSRTGTGRVLATARRRDSDLSGSGRAMIKLGGYSSQEATDYLAGRLTDAGREDLLDGAVPTLAEDLGWLPLALSHAAAYMIDQSVTCGRYLDLLADGTRRLDDLMKGDPDGHGRRPDGSSREVSVTLLLALDAADSCIPVGLARPALTLAAVMDAAGHPEEVWRTKPVLRYLSTHRVTPSAHSVATPTDGVERGSAGDDCASRDGDPEHPGVGSILVNSVTAADAEAVVPLLARYGLLDLDAGGETAPRDHRDSGVGPQSPPGQRIVSLHQLTARAARERAGSRAVQVAASAAARVLTLERVWPLDDRAYPVRAALLRANASMVAALAGDSLWHPLAGNPLRWKHGRSLLAAGIPGAAVEHWRKLLSDATRFVNIEMATETDEAPGDMSVDGGPGLLLDARANLASALAKTGDLHDLAEAADHREEIVQLLIAAGRPEDDERLLIARVNLAAALARTDRLETAVSMMEDVVIIRAEKHGEHAGPTAAARSVLAGMYHATGRHRAAADLLEGIVDLRDRTLGPDHLDTVRDRANLAVSYASLGRVDDALHIERHVVDVRVRELGEHHPDTLTARVNYAVSLRQLGLLDEALIELRQATEGRIEALGAEHLHSRAALQELQSWTAGSPPNTFAAEVGADAEVAARRSRFRFRR